MKYKNAMLHGQLTARGVEHRLHCGVSGLPYAGIQAMLKNVFGLWREAATAILSSPLVIANQGGRTLGCHMVATEVRFSTANVID